MALASKNVLMLCYFYPPVYTGGVERSVKFAKYLPEYGWKPVVMTTDLYGTETNAGTQRPIRVLDPLNLYHSLFNKAFRRSRRSGRDVVPPKTTPGKGLRKMVLDAVLKRVVIPDIQLGWAVFAFWPAWRLLHRGGANAIYTTSPAESTHLLGLVLKSLSGKPWVMDLRDPWTFESLKELLRDSGLRLLIESLMERSCFKHADAIVINTPKATERYKALYPEYSGKMLTITNGFDAEELTRAAASLDRPSPWRALDDDTFVISHVGAFFRYPGGESTPHALLEALRGLLDERVISADGCQVVFVGNLLDERTANRISELGLEDLIQMPGVVSHFDAMRLMQRSNLLLLFDPSGDGQTYVRGKLYEYLGSGKPVLGMVPDGASRELLKRSGRGSLVYPEDAEGIRRAMAEIIERRAVPAENPDFDLASYEHRKLTGRLAALLDHLTGSRRSGDRRR